MTSKSAEKAVTMKPDGVERTVTLYVIWIELNATYATICFKVIQGQGQRHAPPEVRNPATFAIYVVPGYGTSREANK